MRHKLIGYIFKMAAQHPKLASDSLEKIPGNIAVSFLLRVHDPLCRMDNGIYCLSFELALKLYERKTTNH
jgi:hypothetical protein